MEDGYEVVAGAKRQRSRRSAHDSNLHATPALVAELHRWQTVPTVCPHADTVLLADSFLWPHRQSHLTEAHVREHYCILPILMATLNGTKIGNSTLL